MGIREKWEEVKGTSEKKKQKKKWRDKQTKAETRALKILLKNDSPLNEKAF